MDAGGYTTRVKTDPTTSPSWTDRVEANGERDGVYVDYRYYGVGDRGGSPDEKSVQEVEHAVKENAPIEVISATAAKCSMTSRPSSSPRCRHIKAICC